MAFCLSINTIGKADFTRLKGLDKLPLAFLTGLKKALSEFEDLVDAARS